MLFTLSLSIVSYLCDIDTISSILIQLTICIINKLPSSVNMQKELPIKNLAQSQMNHQHNLPTSLANKHSFYQPRFTVNSLDYSPERMNQSFIASGHNRQNIQNRPEQMPIKYSQAMRSCSYFQFKENARTSNTEAEVLSVPMKLIQQRMLEVQRRMESIEKQQSKGELIVKSVQQVMQLQIKDIKYNQQLEERLILLQQMMKHLKNVKVDRKQLQNGQYPNTKAFEAEIQRLWTRDEASKAQIKDIRDRLQRLVHKIEISVVAVGQKYEEFIQSNIIKSIEHVNKLTQHYHEEIDCFKAEHIKIKDKIQTFLLEKNEYTHKELPQKLMAISIPNLKIIQSIAIVDVSKEQANTLLTKQQSSQSKVTPNSLYFKNNLLNNLYDSIGRSTQCFNNQISLQKIIYKLDREYYLLDEDDHYIVDALSNKIKLSNEHIKALQDNRLLQS